jgi:hypothetical protein
MKRQIKEFRGYKIVNAHVNKEKLYNHAKTLYQNEAALASKKVQ